MSVGWSEDYFKSWDGSHLFCRFFDPPKVRHTLVILHGYGEHSGRYLKFAEKFKGASVRLAIFDLRGMGRSMESSKEARDVRDYLGDVDAFMVHLRNKYRLKDKIILMGHSLGGLIAVEWAMVHSDSIKRLILTSPFLGLPALSFCRGLNAFVKFFAPGYIYKNPVTPRCLSHDPKEVTAYKADRLIVRRISAQLIGSIMDRISRLQKRETVTIPVPVHVLAAGKEKVVDLKATRRFFVRLVAPKKEFTEFDGFYHEICNETEQKRVFIVLKTILEECV